MMVYVLCIAHKLSASNARVNYDLQTQDEVYRQYRALAELVTVLLFVAYFRNSRGSVIKTLNFCLLELSLICTETRVLIAYIRKTIEP